MNENYINILSEKLKNKTEDSIEYQILKIELTKMLENDLKHNNPDKLLNSYIKYFSKKNFKTICIKKDDIFYRGRIGKIILSGSIDDLNKEFIIPYYGKAIEAPPPLYTSGGRFNRSGSSYLYLSTELETCFAEVHLQVGQECSIANFKCNNDIELINLSDFGEDLELKIWYDIITQPVYSETKHLYLITQFIAEVFMKLNINGLYFKSVQADGYNIICFNPDNFELIPYSEHLYMAKKLKYDYIEVEDTVREFSKRTDAHLINSFNSDYDDENESQIEFLYKWIEKEKEN